MASVKASSIPRTIPTTAREAQALATQLASEESALAKAQREARSAAMFTAAEQAVSEASVFDAERAKANAAWESAAADPAVGIAGLFDAFVALRTASAVRSAHLSQANGVMSQVRPKLSDYGVQVEYINNAADSLLRAEFGDALEGVVRSRVDHAASVAGNAVQKRCTDAGEQAASKVK